MKELLPFIILGLATGSLYGLAGIGLVLTYRTSGVFNFAHGAIAAAAAFVFYTLHVEHHIAWPIAAAATLLIFGLGLGSLMEPLTRTLAAASPVSVVVLTVGLILAIEGGINLIYGNVSRYFPPFLPQSGFELGGVLVHWDEVISALVTVVAAGGLYAFLRLSRTGTAMRAVVDSPTLISLTGERPQRVSRTAWALGSSFAALSGILLAPTLGLDVNLLTFLVVQSFGACAIGRFKSLPLTYLGGLVVGVLAAIATKEITTRPWTGLPSSTPFIVLIVVLLIVPARSLPLGRTGLRGIITERPPAPRTRAIVRVAVGAAVLAAVPFVVGTHLPVWTSALSAFVIFGSLALVQWTSGQISLCQYAFVAIGATALAHFTEHGVPWLLALVLAGLVAVPVGALIAFPAVRVSGVYLGLLTIGFAILMQNVAYPSEAMFGQKVYVAVGRPSLGAIDGHNDRIYYFIVLAIAAAVALLLWAVHRGQIGRFLRAMSETPVMLATNGLSVSLTKLLVFCLSAFLAAIGGGLVVTQFGQVSGDPFGPLQSLVLVAVLGICGQRLLRSSILAAALISIAPGYISTFDQDRQIFLFGVAAMLGGLVMASRGPIAEWFARAASESEHRARFSPVRSRQSSPRSTASERLAIAGIADDTADMTIRDADAEVLVP